MFRQNEVIGAISVAHRGVDAFSDTHLELLKTFADQAVIAIENVRLFHEIADKSRQLDPGRDFYSHRDSDEAELPAEYDLTHDQVRAASGMLPGSQVRRSRVRAS